MTSSGIMAQLFGDEDDRTEANDEQDETIDNTTLNQSSEISSDSSSLADLTYSPAKTSKVSQSSSPVIRIRNIEELLQDDNEEGQKKVSVKRVNLDWHDEFVEKPFAEKHLILMKVSLSKDVEKWLTKFVENKTISSKLEFKNLSSMLSKYFAGKIVEKHLMTNKSTKDISVSNTEKTEFIDQTVLFLHIKTSVSKFLQPFERKMKPDVLSKIKADFTQKFFFQMCDTKVAFAKDNRRVILTEDNQKHMKDYLNFFMHTTGYV